MTCVVKEQESESVATKSLRKMSERGEFDSLLVIVSQSDEDDKIFLLEEISNYIIDYCKAIAKIPKIPREEKLFSLFNSKNLDILKQIFDGKKRLYEKILLNITL